MTHPQPDENPHSKPASATLDRALALVEFLRARCSWDAAQTPSSLRRYLLEEAHEVVDAIDAGDESALRDELGDLLLNLAFQVVIGEERGAFDRTAVVEGLEEKMRRRHPHLYGGEAVEWERTKAIEKGIADDAGDAGILRGLVAGADSLAFAHKLQSRVAEVGFDWPDSAGAWAKVEEEVDEIEAELKSGSSLRLEEEIGDLLFAVVNFARLSGVHAPAALARANVKFSRRFEKVEARARDQGIQVDKAGLEVLDRLWNEVKGEER